MREPQQFSVGRIRFLREQDGDGERLLKARLVTLFSASFQVNRAYLVRVDFGWLSKKSVVLAVRSAIVPDEELVKQSAVAFGELFNSKEHLDICFLTEEQEQSCAQVAKPFFEKE